MLIQKEGLLVLHKLCICLSPVPQSYFTGIVGISIFHLYSFPILLYALRFYTENILNNVYTLFFLEIVNKLNWLGAQAPNRHRTEPH